MIIQKITSEDSRELLQITTHSNGVTITRRSESKNSDLFFDYETLKWLTDKLNLIDKLKSD